MILTVTLNTSIDKLYLIDKNVPETVMRVREKHDSAGGKGLNVSRVAALLGEGVTAAGFVGGHNGQYLESLIREQNIHRAFTHVDHETRCCINCWDLSAGVSTEYLEPGAPVEKKDLERFFSDFDGLLPKADVVAVSGSLPKGAPADTYGEIIRRCRGKGVPVLVDTSGEALRAAVQAGPDLIKPNTDEIAQLLGEAPAGEDALIAAAVRLRAGGVSRAVVSLGAEGALMVCAEGVFKGRPPRITPKNTVGCGDSMIAGFAVGMARRLPPEETFRIALAVSAANALSLYTGDFAQEDYDRLYGQVTVEKLQ